MSNCLKALQSDRSRQKLEVGRHVEGRRGTGRVSLLVALHLTAASVSAGGGRTAGRNPQSYQLEEPEVEFRANRDSGR